MSLGLLRLVKAFKADHARAEVGSRSVRSFGRDGFSSLSYPPNHVLLQNHEDCDKPDRGSELHEYTGSGLAIKTTKCDADNKGSTAHRCYQHRNGPVHAISHGTTFRNCAENAYASARTCVDDNPRVTPGGPSKGPNVH